MTDVSHELGALRFVVDSPLSSKVAMFNNQAQQRKKAQLLNPFSPANDGRSSPKPTFTKDEYGKPLAGSLTEMRGQKANMHVLREMLELCQIIDSEGYKVNDEPNMRVIPFGELFNIYNYISDKVVGILLRARKYKYVQFEGEMLFQRRDDDVPVFLLKPIQDIRHEINLKIDEIKRASSPAPPQATSLLLDKGTHQQKLHESALSATGESAASRRSVKSRSASPALPRPPSSRSSSKAPTPTPEEMSTTSSDTPKTVSAALTPVEAKVTKLVPEAVAVALQEKLVKAETATAISNQVVNTETSTNEVFPSVDVRIDAATVPAEVRSTSVVDKVDGEIKPDMSSNGSDCNMTINELPTIIIETTAVYVSGEGGTTLQSTENGAEANVAVTVDPTNST